MPSRSSRFAVLVVLGVALLALAWSLRSSAPPSTSTPLTDAGAPADDARRDLDRDEAAGGHTLTRHVGRSDRELAERLAREPGTAAASTFEDRATAERVVRETLRRERRRIDAWLQRDGDANLALDYRGSPTAPVGRTLLRGEGRSRPAPDARVVLRKREGSFFVLTAYPEEER